ncbi:RagB/SusD family nutrient uptake outer membrane protein [Mariniflexile sp. AS56]|uniref:RagB/SusD family nutrient uptake outer membrane protein n=1 Tax=Mariniflexile sp. AS56 TaxID=3063957 RepID=UPI0026F2B1EC|nr:RagB/SusD family nutrient uptake outer membrane protein [Mariniflexile sp. AS56]MDO7172445.1 RagB/SusD family nutrient uptake outer membrane protein [Mariniflexile sp. AS56]
MKNKYKYIIIAFVTILCGSITSCNSLLDEDARGLLTPDTFFKNAEEATLALNNLNDNVGSAGFLDHLGTDVGVCGRQPLSAAARFGAFEYAPDDGRVANTWSGYYTVVRDANLVLASIERSSLSDAVKGNAIAQTLFFRAFVYLNLVTQFGDVPYWRDELNDIEAVSLLGKTDSKVILNGIIADLEQAIASGYLSTKKWNENEGRPTVWAARMLKAHCHVWLAQYDQTEWAKARTELIEVTANSPHQLSNDYAEMYREGKELHNEIIFGKQLLADIKGSNANPAHWNRPAENGPTRTAMDQLGVLQGSSALCLRKSFANTFNANDKRKLYNVWDSQLQQNGTTTAVFNWVYVPKVQRAPVPVSDPLMSFNEPNGNGSNPDRIFLLADAYLLLAEAEFMIGGSTTAALAAINKVRSTARTGLAPYTAITIEDIRNERGWELVTEGFWGRKKDLVRWGILESIIIGMPAAETDAGAPAEAIARAQAEADIILAGKDGQYLVLPIPLNEVLQSKDIGGALTQNPLWE